MILMHLGICGQECDPAGAVQARRLQGPTGDVRESVLLAVETATTYTHPFGPQKHHSENRPMTSPGTRRPAFRTVATILAAVLTFSSTAREHHSNLGRVPDGLGQINAWWQIPTVLFERCAAIVPGKKDAMQQSMNVWTKNNGDLIDLIAHLVELSVPVFAKDTSA
jgi:hypothetical protein